MKKLLALAIVILGFTAVSFGQSAVSGAATASATILTPIAVSKTADLNFGNIVNISGGSVILAPLTATRNPSAGVSLPSVTGTVSAAQFQVTGDATSTYNISLPATITLLSGANNMVVNTFTSAAVAGVLGTLPGTVGSTTTQDVSVGATLVVGAGQAAGLYTNTSDLKMTVNYN